MVPESVKYLNTVCSKHYGHLYTARARHRSPGVAETLSLLGLLSAMLERNCPTREGTAAYSSYGSRVSSSLRSSILLSAASSRCSSAVSRASSVTSLHGGRLSPLSLSDSITSDHGASEIGFTFSANNINSVEAQILSILAFAFIWSIGAYVPFRSVCWLLILCCLIHDTCTCMTSKRVLMSTSPSLLSSLPPSCPHSLTHTLSPPPPPPPPHL